MRIFSFHFPISTLTELLRLSLQMASRVGIGRAVVPLEQRPESEEEPQANLCLQGSDSKDLRVVAVVTARWTTRTTWSMIR